MTIFLEKAFALLQLVLPHHLLSRLVGYVARSQNPWIKNTFIVFFINRFGIDLSEAKIEDPRAFKNFNAFFTRELKDGLRPIAEGDNTIACPADGAISQLGNIRGADLLQAKGHYYSVYELLGGDADLAREFQNGHFCTVYLSPKDYHRVHMPFTGTLREMIYVPGRLFSVNQATTRQISDLFARNERAVCIFDTDQGPMAVILVGAMIVAGIETVFAGQVAPQPRDIQRQRYDQPEKVVLNKGDELGRFMLGSTAILLFPEGTASFLEGLNADSPVQMGEALGEFQKP